MRLASYLGSVYSTCLRCNRSLGANAEIPHLRIGRRIAFDSERGRLWVICLHCGQWNLTPLEERWEALAECERLTKSAEAHANGTIASLAQTTSGLELLRVGGMSDADIANWRYGRRIHDRQQRQLLKLMPMEGVAVALGIMTWRTTGSLPIGLYVVVITGIILFSLWYTPPRLWRRFSDGEGGRHFLWPWQLQDLRVETDAASNGPPVLVVPRVRSDLRLSGTRAAHALASLLPAMNGADCGGSALAHAIAQVTEAEQEARRPPKRPGRAARRRQRAHGVVPRPQPARRPWELVLGNSPTVFIASVAPERRLALEMAVTEELEQGELRARTENLAEEWPDEEEIGAISDELLLSDSVRDRLAHLKVSTANLSARVREDGWAVTPALVPPDVLDELTRELTPLLDAGAARAGARHLLDIESVRAFARSASVREVAEAVLGAECVAVRGILFDKTPDANWKVMWHQDLTIAVRERCDVAGFGPWTEKDGVPHVQPTMDVMERMLAVRVHLDECGIENGPVRVIPGSHRAGRLSAHAIDEWKRKGPIIDCVAERGSILAFRPLLLHASFPATTPEHRRVVHLEFASGALPAGLAWHDAV